MDVHSSAQLLHVLSYDIHAYATPGDRRHLLGSGESRLENKVIDFRIQELRAGRDKTSADSLGEDFFAVQTPAVITHFHDNVARLVSSLERNGRSRVFAGRGTFSGILDAMVERIAQHVHERI